MAGEIAWMVIAVAKSGKQADLEALAHRAAAWTKGNEPGVLEYAWRVAPETGETAIHVKIASAEAANAHLGNFARRFLTHLLECAEIRRTLVFASPPAPVRRKLEALNPVYMTDAAAFFRKAATGPSLLQ